MLAFTRRDEQLQLWKRSTKYLLFVKLEIYHQSLRMTVRKCAIVRRSLIGSRNEPRRTKTNIRPGLFVYTGYNEIKRSSILHVLPSSVKLRPTRPYDPIMGSNASSGLGNEATYGIRDMRKMETENAFNRPTEHPEKTNRKSRQLFPLSSTSHNIMTQTWLNCSTVIILLQCFISLTTMSLLQSFYKLNSFT